MFSVLCVFQSIRSRGCPVTINHDASDLTIEEPPPPLQVMSQTIQLEPCCTGIPRHAQT